MLSFSCIYMPINFRKGKNAKVCLFERTKYVKYLVVWNKHIHKHFINTFLNTLQNQNTSQLNTILNTTKSREISLVLMEADDISYVEISFILIALMNSGGKVQEFNLVGNLSGDLLPLYADSCR